MDDAAICKALTEFKGSLSAFIATVKSPCPAAARSRWSMTMATTRWKWRPTLAAARGAFPGRRLLLAFQPHRYTRTRRLFRGLRQGAVARRCTLSRPKCMPREKPLSLRPMAARWHGPCEWWARWSRFSLKTLRPCRKQILDVARAGDVVLTMGAGSIGAGVPGKLVEMQ